MATSRLLAGLALAVLLAGPAAGLPGGCGEPAAPADCGCPAPEPGDTGPSLEASCCCGCEAPDPGSPRPGKESPVRPVGDEAASLPAPQVGCVAEPPDAFDPIPPLAGAASAAPPLFLLHRSLRF